MCLRHRFLRCTCAPPTNEKAPVPPGALDAGPAKSCIATEDVARAADIPEAEFYRRRCADLRDELEFFVAASNEDRAENRKLHEVIRRLQAELAEARLQARGADEYWRLETARANKERKTAVSIAARYSRALDVIRQLSPKQ